MSEPVKLRTREMVALGDCLICGRKQLEGQLPLFYRVQISRGGFLMDAVRRGAGLEMAFGALAHVLSPDAPIAQIIETSGGFVHEECADKIPRILALMKDAEAEKAA